MNRTEQTLPGLIRASLAKGFSTREILSMVGLAIGLFSVIVFFLNTREPAPPVDEEARILELRRSFFVNTARKMFRELPRDAVVELKLGKQSNRVILTGGINGVALPELTFGMDEISLDYFDGHIVATHFSKGREISRIYLVEKVKSLVWEVYSPVDKEWSPLYLSDGTLDKPTRIRLKYQMISNLELVETFGISSEEETVSANPKLTSR